jgi:carbon-monoxide dehydrogenase medium subunit
MMKLRLAVADEIIDLDAIDALSEFSTGDGMLSVGAMVRHRAFEYGPLPSSLPILRDAAEGIADQQVRNRGTIGGSIANADPGGDWAPVLLATGATVELVGPGGERTVAIELFFVDAYTTEIESSEIIRRIRIPIPAERSGSGYVAFKLRTGDFAAASAAVRVDLDANGVCASATVALGNVALKPLLVEAAPGIMRGRDPFDRGAAGLLGDAAAEAADPFADTHGSVAYKRSLTKTLVMRALNLAARRARGETVDANIYK